jgi:hypothetical protein
VPLSAQLELIEVMFHAKLSLTPPHSPCAGPNLSNCFQPKRLLRWSC